MQAGGPAVGLGASTQGTHEVPDIQPKLTVNEPDDKYEKEAERVADAVMRMPGPKEGVDTQEQLPAHRIQRMCPRCRRRHRQGKPLDCEECEAALQRAARGAADGDAERAVRSVRGGGSPIPPRTRTFFEERVGYDFGDVRVHTDRRADEAARAVNARAFTLGRDVVFRSGAYRPDTDEGRRLLAHELTHVVQKGAATRRESPDNGGLSTGRQVDGGDSSGPEVDGRGDSEPAVERGDSTEPRVHRRPGKWLARTLQVEEPEETIPDPTGEGATRTNAETAREYLNELCSTGVDVDLASGEVTTSEGFCSPIVPGLFDLPSPAELTSKPSGCTCVCDIVHSSNRWTIRIDDENWPHTEFDDREAAEDPTSGGTGGTVTAPSPNSPKVWGAATESGEAVNIDPWLVLGHELCGHAWLGNAGRHCERRKRGEGGHQKTVERENLIREEHGIERRGGFRDPHCGESYWRESEEGPKNWSVYRDKCKQWRERLNELKGTDYDIDDRIPEDEEIPWDELEDE